MSRSGTSAAAAPAGRVDLDHVRLRAVRPPDDEIAENARQRGWPVLHVPGTHLHMVVDPEAVADAVRSAARRL